jgi:hypothetical protein
MMRWGLSTGEATSDGAKDGTDLGAENGQDTDDNDSNQNQDQCIFDEALALFAWQIHGVLLEIIAKSGLIKLSRSR